jgi:apolipoprotein N-acyltransferase
MAVFRAVENGRSMVRATASGQTCGISPNGKIIAMAPPFAEAWLTVAVPVAQGETLYTRWGDYLAQGFTALAVFLLLFGGIISILVKKRRKP